MLNPDGDDDVPEGPSASGQNRSGLSRPSPTASTSNHRTLLASVRQNSDGEHSDPDVRSPYVHGKNMLNSQKI
jgi:hypothetical protein